MSDQPPPGYHEVTRSSSTTTGKSKDDRSNFALLSFSGSDRLRLLRFPDELTPYVVEMIGKGWFKGIQDVKHGEEGVEVKLRGNPFVHGLDDEKRAIRKLILEILDMLAKEGWVVIPAGGVGKIAYYSPHGEKGPSILYYSQIPEARILMRAGSLIFQRQQPQDLGAFCISFDSRDLIHLINATSALAQSVMTTFGNKIESCNQDLMSGNFEIKFRDHLWWQPTKKGSLESRLAILQMVQCLDDNGFKLYTSVDFDNATGGSTYQISAEIWYCCRQ